MAPYVPTRVFVFAWTMMVSIRSRRRDSAESSGSRRSADAQLQLASQPMSLEDRMLERPRREAVADQLDPGRAAGELGLQPADRFAAEGVDEAVERPERFLAVAPDIPPHRAVRFDADDPEVAVERDALGEQP